MAAKPPKIALFCDEAGKDTDRFLAVGGLVVTQEDAPIIRAEFNRRKAGLRLNAEAKWNSTRKGTLDKHRELTQWAFERIRERELLFHCLLVDFQRFDHGLRPDGGKAESLKRMYYQLILHRLCKKHGRQYDCYAYVDEARELQGLERLKRGLNSDANRRYECQDSLKALEFRVSHTEPLLQINDLILGAICAQKNRRFEDPEAGQPKANFAGYVLGKSGLINYDTDTPREVSDFTIWNLKSQYLRGGGT
jgi:hypothetical protein